MVIYLHKKPTQSKASDSEMESERNQCTESVANLMIIEQ